MEFLDARRSAIQRCLFILELGGKLESESQSHASNEEKLELKL